MTLPSNDRLTELMHELEELRAELAQIHRQQTQNRWRLSIGLLAVSLVILTSGAWSAQTVDPALLDIQKRLSALESLVHKGPANTTQVTGPLDVIGTDGKLVLQVGGDPVEAAVAIWSEPGVGGRTRIRSHNGVSMGGLGAKSQGNGMVGQAFVADSEGNVRAWMTGQDGGAVLVAKKGDFKEVAGMTIDSGGSPQVIVQKGKSSVIITEGNEGGYISMSDSKGKPGTFLRTGSISVFNKEGLEAAEMTADDGWGRVQVLNKAGKVVAKMDSERTIQTGVISVMNAAGKHAGALFGIPTGAGMTLNNSEGAVVASLLSAEGFGKLGLYNSTGKQVVQVTGGGKAGGAVAVANSESKVLAEIFITDDGRGQFQVKKNQQPLAALTEALERPGGLLQVYSMNGAVASVTVGQTGGGYWQLTNAAGVPTVEAGTAEDGRGTVRAGPLYKCVSVKTPLLSGGILDCILGSIK